MDRHNSLTRLKPLNTLMLCCAALTFVVTTFLPTREVAAQATVAEESIMNGEVEERELELAVLKSKYNRLQSRFVTLRKKQSKILAVCSRAGLSRRATQLAVTSRAKGKVTTR